VKDRSRRDPSSFFPFLSALLPVPNREEEVGLASSAFLFFPLLHSSFSPSIFSAGEDATR